jgi:hypothetical protein
MSLLNALKSLFGGARPAVQDAVERISAAAASNWMKPRPPIAPSAVAPRHRSTSGVIQHRVAVPPH